MKKSKPPLASSLSTIFGSRTSPAALKALLVQGVSWSLVIALLSQGILPTHLWAVVLAQSTIAALLAVALRSERWWIIIHLGFSPLLVLAHGLQIAPGWYLAAFALLTALYWTTFRTRVPLYLSNRQTVVALDQLVASRRPRKVLDLGSGTGTILVALAHQHPDISFTGIETAPGPYLIGRVRARRQPNIEWVRGDFFSRSWADFDLIYAFLSPVPMSAVGDKAMREMRPGSILISNSFAIPGLQAHDIIKVGDKRGTLLFVYDPHCKAATDARHELELAV